MSPPRTQARKQSSLLSKNKSQTQSVWLLFLPVCAMRDLNSRPSRCKRAALPTELIAQIYFDNSAFGPNVTLSYSIFRKKQ